MYKWLVLLDCHGAEKIVITVTGRNSAEAMAVVAHQCVENGYFPRTVEFIKIN